ncbi:hypothetical protein BG53_08380 [Paenibacillus darwinianus]|uniref:Metal-binding protein n=1 Tax=Paenibacillus darwinianus TaxID=1380763 RepID=A0A9W5RZZ4_9BACL|nr:DUF177 domain-containing protein [Paenibacillus darwinianus]EXX84643.1 hypothetical protein BG52_10310 [Paenibacillus darwinianus]EXX85445.1 hypothetical protein BG53_08380 [Paenibacillus darwinianus]EXX86682.1 hypothetical protein CH50_06800 [Paenibacillus darwinianus]
MNIHMQELIAKGMTRSFHTSLDVAPLLKDRPDVLRSSPLAVALEARGEEGAVRVGGELSIELELACSRCLTPTTEKFVIPFHEFFRPASDNKEADEEEDEVIVVEGDSFDLLPFVEQAFLLYLPFAPLCGDACKGLCPQCGANLNEGECGCSRERLDPRMAALKDFFKQE